MDDSGTRREAALEGRAWFVLGVGARVHLTGHTQRTGTWVGEGPANPMVPPSLVKNELRSWPSTEHARMEEEVKQAFWRVGTRVSITRCPSHTRIELGAFLCTQLSSMHSVFLRVTSHGRLSQAG